jgi:peptide/nickel transport system permease protein
MADIEPEGIPGVVPRPDAWPPGCRFAPRCTHAREACSAAPPVLEELPDHAVRCIRWRELTA